MVFSRFGIWLVNERIELLPSFSRSSDDHSVPRESTCQHAEPFNPPSQTAEHSGTANTQTVLHACFLVNSSLASMTNPRSMVLA